MAAPDAPTAPPGPPREGPFDRLARAAANALGATAAVFVVARDGAGTCEGAFGLPGPPDERPPATALLDHLGDGPLAAEDVSRDGRLAVDPLVARAAMPALLGVPLQSDSTRPIACLAVLDARPREWSPRDAELLGDLAETARAGLEAARLRDEARAYEETARREGREKAAVLAGTPEELFLLDAEGRITLLNPKAARFFQLVTGRPVEQLLGKVVWEACPEVADSTFAREYRLSEKEQRAFQLETYFPGIGRWFAFHGIRTPEGLCVTFHDVTERVRLERALRDRAEELAASDRGKEEFLLQLAHELRNSLAPIRNALHVWGAPGAGPGDREQAREMAEREVGHVSRLLEDTLKVGQLAPGSLEGELEWMDLAAVVADAVRDALASPAARGHNLVVHLPPEPLPVEGDRALLGKALAHLLDNAVKFTPPGGEVRLEGAREGAQVVLRVRDNGVGIDAELLPRVFDLFMRRSGPRGRLQGGLGVGLTLVRRVAERHGGAVEAHSDGPGHGSEFVLRLPGVAEHEPALPGTPAAGAEPPEKALRILVVDDSKDAAQGVALLLRVWGYEVHVAYDPLAALDEAATLKPDVVLLDIGMPGMDGYEVARRLRRQPEARNMMLAAVTGYGEAEHRRRAEEAGFDYHLVKPVAPDDLRALLHVAAASLRPNLYPA
jgi:signal transduction histidine kinase/ActR/RegA family two-component response regulator